MLELRNICKRYAAGKHRVDAVIDVSLHIDPGEFVSIVGPSGSGKSTLLHIAGALDYPDSGSVRLGAQDIGDLNERRRSAFRRRQIGFIFQFFNLLPTMSAWENVAVPAMLDGRSLRSAKETAMSALAKVGLAERADHRPPELSGGQIQRVAIARALMMDPPVILADEPTGNLDTRSGRDVVKLLAEIPAASGTPRAVVMVTHDTDAAAVTDRVMTMQDGRLTAGVAR